MKIAILIPIYNRIEITQKGLQALYDALSGGGTAHSYEVVVIDDASTDGSADWIKHHYPDIHLLQGDGNLWWSGCINLGAAYATETMQADALLLWNDDIRAASDYFIEADKYILSTGLENCLIGSKIFSKETGKIWSVGGYFEKLTGKYGMYTDPGNTTGPFFDCDWLPGMGTFVPTSILKNHGLTWDSKRFPQYHGDSAFGLTCKRKGVRVKTCLPLVIYNTTLSPSIPRARTFKDLWVSLTSIRSNKNIRKRLLFHWRFGIFPFAFWDVAVSYFIIFGSFFKRNILKIDR